MIVLLKSYLFFFKRIFRFVYWQYRWLNNAKTGKNGIIQLPVRFEGNGKFNIGNSYTIGNRVFLGIDRTAVFLAKDKLHICDNADIRIGLNSTLLAGNSLKIESGVKLVVNGKWQIGNNVVFCTNSQLASREAGYFGNLVIGNCSEIGDNTIVDVSSDVIIGNDVSIGPNCILYTHNHLYSDKRVAAWKGGVIASPIIIEDGAWVASGVTILPGVRIGKRTVVAAGAVVTNNLDDESLYGGVPARLIKKI